ncbi:MAG: hypothetical protein M3336_01040 [Chloroflexota bacterium]|nr:hypothetical protein [Chloroflexota bacterium]
MTSLDPVGAFRFGEVPAGRHGVSESCERVRGFPQHLGEWTADVRSGDTLRLNVAVHTAGCDTRPVVVVEGEFRGHYT